MLECRACFNRYFQALVSTNSFPRASPLRASERANDVRRLLRAFHGLSTSSRPLGLHQSCSKSKVRNFRSVHSSPRRNQGSAATTSQEDEPSYQSYKSYIVGDRYHDSPQAREARAKQRAALTPKEDAPSFRKKLPWDLDEMEKKKTLARLSSELKYLRDPKKLADHVAHVLRHDDQEKATALIRLSSRSIANVVSWNHLIDWQMKKGKTKAALDTYNEMKKRAVKPDSYTYLLLLRGLANFAHHPHSLGRALSLYHAINAPHSQVSQTIMHTNAVIKVCARANDRDSIWDIVSRLPERGPHAADNMTFTTILNDTRVSALVNAPEKETPEDAAYRKEAAIIDGRRLWEVIVKRWRAGDLLVDEGLVCSMGRLLLIGSRPRDWDDVLSLIQQAMDIPRLVPELGSRPRRAAQLPPIRGPNIPNSMKDDTIAPGNEFKSIERPPTQSLVQATIKSRHISAYARPSNATLSLVLDACLKLIAKAPATNYWDLLTDSNGAYIVKPDLDNIHMYLRILRQSRSSKAALDLLKHHAATAIATGGPHLGAKAFRIAMGACVRDAKNPSIVCNATEMIQVAMEECRGDVGPRLLLEYLEACLDCHVNAATEDPETLGQVLSRVEPCVVKLKTLLTFDPETAAGNADGKRHGEQGIAVGDTSDEFGEEKDGAAESTVTQRSQRAAPAPAVTRTEFSTQNLDKDRDDAFRVLCRMQSGYDRALTLSARNSAANARGADASAAGGSANAVTTTEAGGGGGGGEKGPGPALPEWKVKAFTQRSGMLNSFVTRFQRRYEYQRRGGVRWRALGSRTGKDRKVGGVEGVAGER